MKYELLNSSSVLFLIHFLNRSSISFIDYLCQTVITSDNCREMIFCLTPNDKNSFKLQKFSQITKIQSNVSSAKQK